MKTALVFVVLVALGSVGCKGEGGCPRSHKPMMSRYESGDPKEQGCLKLSENGDYVRDGAWTTWHEHNIVKEQYSYRDGLKDGHYTAWHENGVMFVDGGWERGEPRGLVRFWHPNGVKKLEQHYDDHGLLQGVVQSWYSSGTPEAAVPYRDGKRHGRAEFWYENGAKMGELNYEEDLQHGLQVTYYENGMKEAESTWDHAVMLPGERKWREDGTPR